MKTGLTAIVPMRHHSERVAGKNYRLFAGKPLFFHILTTLQNCPSVNQVVVDTDSPDIMKKVGSDFPEVRILERPHNLRGGETPMNDILLHDVKQVQSELYLQVHSTSPLLKSETIERAVHVFIENRPKHDSLFGVTRLQARLWDAQGKAINHEPDVLLRTQDLPPIYLENSCLYLFSKETLERHRNRIGAHPYLFEVGQIEAWDIDEESDFQIAEVLFENARRKS